MLPLLTEETARESQRQLLRLLGQGRRLAESYCRDRGLPRSRRRERSSLVFPSGLETITAKDGLALIGRLSRSSPGGEKWGAMILPRVRRLLESYSRPGAALWVAYQDTLQSLPASLSSLKLEAPRSPGPCRQRQEGPRPVHGPLCSGLPSASSQSSFGETHGAPRIRATTSHALQPVESSACSQVSCSQRPTQAHGHAAITQSLQSTQPCVPVEPLVGPSRSPVPVILTEPLNCSP